MDVTEKERIKRGHQYEASRTAPPEGFPKLPMIPAGRYVDPEFFALEMEHVWRKSWVYGIHGDEAPNPGDYVRWNRLGEPLVFVRGEDGNIRCFYNVCAHRGAPVLVPETGTARLMVCNYHGWSYDLHGALVNLRDKRDFVGLDMSCHSLREVRCESIGPWHFVNMDKDAVPLTEYLGPVARHMRELSPDENRLMHKQVFKVGCNIKVLLDAFFEVYHLKSIHQSTVDRFLDHRGTYITLWPQGHSRMITPNRREGWTDPGTKGLPETPGVDPYFATTNLSVHGYPGLVSPLASSGVPMLCFWPIDLKNMMVEVHWFGPSWGDGPRPEIWDTRIRNFARILDEDLQFADSIQKSVESDGFTGMTLNYQERRIYHWHEELDRRIGVERVPAHLRVPQILAPYVEQDSAPQALSAAE